jgi:hypothetical protein
VSRPDGLDPEGDHRRGRDHPVAAVRPRVRQRVGRNQRSSSNALAGHIGTQGIVLPKLYHREMMWIFPLPQIISVDLTCLLHFSFKDFRYQDLRLFLDYFQNCFVIVFS